MQRNPQNSVKSTGIFAKGAVPNPAGGAQPHSTGGGLPCPACGTVVPPKSGFRPSALKCPKCGKPLVRK